MNCWKRSFEPLLLLHTFHQQKYSSFRETSNISQKQPPEVFYKGVLKNFTKFSEKHLCQSLLFNKVAGLRTASLLKKTLAQVFSCEFWEIFKNNYFEKHLRMVASDIFTILIEHKPYSKLFNNTVIRDVAMVWLCLLACFSCYYTNQSLEKRRSFFSMVIFFKENWAATVQ